MAATPRKPTAAEEAAALEAKELSAQAKARKAVTPKDKNPEVVRVRTGMRGFYHNAIREEGEEFDNTLNLAVFPKDPNAWFYDASLKEEPDANSVADEEDFA